MRCTVLQMWGRGHFQGSCRSKKEDKGMGRAKSVGKVQKPAKVHRMKAEAWTGQPYAAQHNLSLHGRTPEMMFHHMRMVHMKSLNKEEEKPAHLALLADGTSQCTSSQIHL